ncbi:unnamed protein product, partial [Mycena citricolor]
ESKRCGARIVDREWTTLLIDHERSWPARSRARSRQDSRGGEGGCEACAAKPLYVNVIAEVSMDHQALSLACTDRHGSGCPVTHLSNERTRGSGGRHIPRKADPDADTGSPKGGRSAEL